MGRWDEGWGPDEGRRGSEDCEGPLCLPEGLGLCPFIIC